MQTDKSRRLFCGNGNGTQVTILGLILLLLSPVNGVLAVDAPVVAATPSVRAGTTITITSQASATPNPAKKGDAVSFSAAASVVGAGAIIYTWDFGDSTTGVGASASHVYAADGSYTAVVTITDGVSTVTSSVKVKVGVTAADGPIVLKEFGKVKKLPFEEMTLACTGQVPGQDAVVRFYTPNGVIDVHTKDFDASTFTIAVPPYTDKGKLGQGKVGVQVIQDGRSSNVVSGMSISKLQVTKTQPGVVTLGYLTAQRDIAVASLKRVTGTVLDTPTFISSIQETIQALESDMAAVKKVVDDPNAVGTISGKVPRPLGKKSLVIADQLILGFLRGQGSQPGELGKIALSWALAIGNKDTIGMAANQALYTNSFFDIKKSRSSTQLKDAIKNVGYVLKATQGIVATCVAIEAYAGGATAVAAVTAGLGAASFAAAPFVLAGVFVTAAIVMYANGDKSVEAKDLVSLVPDLIVNSLPASLATKLFVEGVQDLGIVLDVVMKFSDKPFASVSRTISEIDELGTGSEFVVTLSSAPKAPLTVAYTLSGSAVDGTDYTSSGSLAFDAGTTSKSISISPKNNNMTGDTEVTITLNDGVGYNVATKTSSITIKDSTTATVKAKDAEIKESGPGTDFVVTLSSVPKSVITVNYTFGGTGGLGSDYTSTGTGTLTFPVGQTTQTISITPKDNNSVGDKTVTVTLVKGTGYTVSGDAATVTIKDNVIILSVTTSGLGTVTAISTPPVSVGANATKTFQFPPNTLVVLTLTPDTDQEIDSWSYVKGGVTTPGTAKTLTINMTESVTFNVTFLPKPTWTVTQRNVTIKLFDNSFEDGDIVTVTLNGKEVVSNLSLTNAGNVYNINLVAGNNILVVKAINEASPPNTCSMTLSNVVSGAPETYDLSQDQGSSTTLVIRAP